MLSLRRVLAGALVLLSTLAHAGLRPDDHLEPGDGAVLLTVTIDYPNFANQNAIAALIPPLSVERVDGGAGSAQRYVLGPRVDGMQSTRAYAGSLPPGRYRIYDVVGSNCKLFCGAGGISMPPAGQLAEFTIVPGHVRFLGTVLVSAHPPVKPSKDWIVNWAYTDAPDRVLGQRLLSGLYPQLAAAASGGLAEGGWEADSRGPGAAAAARELIRRGNAGVFNPSPYGADGFLLGANNGVVKRWTPRDGVRLLDTGSPYLIRSAIDGGNGRLLAGGEASMLRYSQDDGRTWSDVGAGLPYGIVIRIAPIGGDELVFALQQDTQATLYRGKFGDTHWTKVGEWPLQFKFWTGLAGAQPELQAQGRRVALTLPTKRGVVVDLDSGATHEITPPGSLAMFSWSADGVMRCTCIRSIAANPWESRDQGVTWTDSPIDRWMLLPVFRDEQTGFSFKGALFNKKNTAVMQTHDGGKTWTASPPPTVGGWWRPAYSADGKIMLLSGFSVIDKLLVEQVYWSADDGASWTAWANEGVWQR